MHLQFTILLLMCVTVFIAEKIPEFSNLKMLFNKDRNFRKGLTTMMKCEACNNAVARLMNFRQLGSSDDRMVNLLQMACLGTALWISSSVCFSLAKIHHKELLYIIDNKNITAIAICSTVLQESCPTNEFSWNVEIAKGKSKNKLKGDPEATPIKVLHLTDVHYDSLYTPGSNAECDKPLCCQVDSITTFIPHKQAGYWADYRHCDTSMLMMTESLTYIKDNLEYDYIYFTGDIVGHRIWETSISKNSKDIDTFYHLIKEKLSKKPIYPILGNHEPHPLDLFAPKDVPKEFSTQWLFDKAWSHWEELLPKDTKETILKGGYYTVLVKPGFRIIALNNNVAYTLNFWILYEDGDTYGQLKWFQEILAKAEKAGEQVHVLMHLPNGDSYTYTPWAKQFALIVERYSTTIKGFFYGHTHLSEMNVLYTSKGVPMSVGYNGGSLTPYEDVNPNFRIFKIDSKNMDILDFDEYIFNVTEANMNTDHLPWKKLYSFKSEYELKSLSPASLDKLVTEMSNNKDLRMKYYRNLMKHGDPAIAKGCDVDCQKEMICKWVTTVYKEFDICNKLSTNIKSLLELVGLPNLLL